MTENASVQFFDQQFRRQVAAGEHELNPFEIAALPYLRGEVLDYGCGLGNLAIGGCKNFCVNGQQAGNCRIVRSDDDRSKKSRTERIVGQPAG